MISVCFSPNLYLMHKERPSHRPLGGIGSGNTPASVLRSPPVLSCSFLKINHFTELLLPCVHFYGLIAGTHVTHRGMCTSLWGVSVDSAGGCARLTPGRPSCPLAPPASTGRYSCSGGCRPTADLLRGVQRDRLEAGPGAAVLCATREWAEADGGR